MHMVWILLCISVIQYCPLELNHFPHYPQMNADIIRTKHCTTNPFVNFIGYTGGVTVLGLSHSNDVIISAIASQITSRMIVYSIVYSGADQRKYQSSASLAFVWGILR